MSIEDLPQSIGSREDFTRFLDHLIQNLRQEGEGWENRDLASYLEGMAGFARDLEGYYRNRGEEVDLTRPSWRLLADILLAARVYE